MSAVPVANYLADVGPDASRGKRAGGQSPASEQAKGQEILASLAAAHTRGLAEGKAVAQADGERKLEEQRVASEERLAAERARWTSEEAERLRDLIVGELKDLEVRIGDQVARILKPWLAAEAQRRAVAELGTMLEDVLHKGEVVQLSVSGPEDLLTMLRTNLEGKIGNVKLTPAPGCELRLVADQTVFETRIADWVKALEESKA
jgi:hypothetical protein